MANTTRAVLRQRVSEALGDYYSLTTSGAGTCGGTTVVDTSLKELPNGDDPCGFENWYALITSGTNNGESRRIASSVATCPPTLTVQSAYTAQVASSVTFELHRHDPADYHIAINAAIRRSWPDLYLPLVDETLVIDDRLANSDFETFACGFTGWTVGGAGGAVASEGCIVMHGTRAAKVCSAASAKQLSQILTVNINELTGKTVHAKFWAYTTTACTAKLRLDWGGGCVVEGAFHSGKDQWERLLIDAAVPSGATQVRLVLETATGCKTTRWDAGYLEAQPVYNYTVPSAFIRVNHVSEQTIEDNPKDNYLPINVAPERGMRLRLEGMGTLSEPSNDTGTTQVGDPQAAYVVKLAEYEMNRILWGRAAGEQRERYQENMTLALSDAQGLIQKPGVRMPRLGAGDSRGAWNLKEDACGKTLVFTEWRG